MKKTRETILFSYNNEMKFSADTEDYNTSIQTKFCESIRINKTTGEKEYFFPMEITDPSIREYATVHGLVIGMAKLGNRVYEAVMVPCLNREKATTTSKEQHKIYRILIQEELEKQNIARKMSKDIRQA